ncbi:MAG TPA: Tim44 domain-containing protein [Candidatus Methylomirabilis sp.]|jgi:predicted lipid-binding transport protein (Tim44 family)
MKTTPLRVLGLLGLLVAAGLYLAEMDAFARAGGGTSSGSRGSRSFSSPSRPYSSPSRPQPSQQPLTQPRPAAPAPAPQPAPVSSFWRSMAGGLAGGFLGAMLFRGLAGAGGFGGMGGGGIGFLDILLLATIGFGIYWWVKKRREEAPVPAEGYYERQAGVGYHGPPMSEGATAPQEPLFQDADLQAGLGHIRQMDARFDEAAFRELCTDNFFKIQAGWMNREVDPIAHLLTIEMQNEFRRQLDGLKRDGRFNRLENIAVRTVEITEAWQESGQDYITVRFLANLLDYTVDERTGQVVEGSKTEPVKFEEYWTWTRPVGPNPWRLSAINQPD